MKIRTDITNYFGRNQGFLLFVFPNIEIGYGNSELTLTFSILFWTFTIAFDWGKEEK